MNLTLATLADPASFAAAFNRVAAVPAPIDTPIARQVLQLLASGPATWWRLEAEIHCTRSQLDSTLTAMLAAHQIVRLDHVGGFQYGLHDSVVLPVSTQP